MMTKNTSNTTEPFIFDSEAKTKIGAVTYIVAAYFDETRDCLPDKIRRLLRTEVERKIAHLQTHGQ